MASEKREFLFIRHAESETNVRQIFQSGNQVSSDPLTAKGEQQAQLLANEFDRLDYQPDIIISSSYLRARQTAYYLGAITSARIIVPVFTSDGNITDRPVEEITDANAESLFRELDLPSELQGLAYDNPVAKQIRTEIKTHEYDGHWHYSDEENYADVLQRAGIALSYLSERQEAKIAIVTHGGFIESCIASTMFVGRDWTLKRQIEHYRALADVGWVDNAGVAALFRYKSSSQWQWPFTYNQHLSGKFGFLYNEPDETTEPATEKLHETEK